MQARPGAPDSNKLIMLVDDEPDIVQVSVRALQMKGYHVAGFTDPVQAAREFQQNQDKYSLVISDIRMPVMSGFELLLHVKRLNPDVKVILMTAYDYEKDQINSDLPVEGFLMKPLSPTQLKDNIDRHLEPGNAGNVGAKMFADLQAPGQVEPSFRLTD
ncbi:MAG: response regulator [Nitrososphaera sp.]